MATMMREKRREKKGTKKKQATKSEMSLNLNSTSEPGEAENIAEPVITITDIATTSSTNDEVNYINDKLSSKFETNTKETIICGETIINEDIIVTNTNNTVQTGLETKRSVQNYMSIEATEVMQHDAIDLTSAYDDLNCRLERMALPKEVPDFSTLNQLEERLEVSQAYLHTDLYNEAVTADAENLTPSAPMIEEREVPMQFTPQRQGILQEAKVKLKPMSLEEVMRLCGGKEMAEIKAMSEREEAIVEAGPISGPEHPLVDLLSTFRCSLAAVDRERINIARSVIEEEKYRISLWKVEKRYVNMTEECKCGLNVQLQAAYEHAELLKERLPTARMKLEALLRDVQDSYCHYQHSALLAYYQIEELIYETMTSSKADIREALSLLLGALRHQSAACWAPALQRWAQALCAALLDYRDLRQLLFLVHHLFRQTRSVRWAAPLIYVSCNDSSEAARVVALIELLLGRTAFEATVECTEDEAWEEMDKHGSGAVSEGALRERDLLALLRALPLREMVARAVLIPHMDIRNAVEREWCVADGGRGVVRACAAVRALAAALQRALAAHPRYTRLHAALRAIALRALSALAALHLHNISTYSMELQERIEVELEACFAAGFVLMDDKSLHELPTNLLSHDTARDYCMTVALALHDKSPKVIESLSVEMPMMSCAQRVRVITRAAAERPNDPALAQFVLDLLFQIGFKRKTTPCKNGCETTAQESLDDLLDVHQYLHATAFHMLADLNEESPLETLVVKYLLPYKWRPTDDEIKSVLDDWSHRCPQFLEHLLLDMNYTPNIGVSLEAQLAIAAWLRRGVRGACQEWAWRTLRRLRLHRSWWALGTPPQSPEDPSGLFDDAYALLATSWGHCIPLVCEFGSCALKRLARARPRDAAYCLAPLMLVMAHSPESISLTPTFLEVFNALLNSGPSLMQRALGRGSPPGLHLLLRVILSHLDGDSTFGVSRSSLVSAWLHALWQPTLPPSALSVLDTALVACRDWPQIDAHAALLVQQSESTLSHVVRNAAASPLLCESALRAAAAADAAASPRLLLALHGQRLAARRIHVDDALKQVGAATSSEDLVIYRTANAVLVVPHHHPSHLMLWRLFFHLYLQRPPGCSQDSTPPVGPLFFSGIMKSRTLAQLKRRLQEALTYHHNEIETLQNQSEENTSESEPSTSRIGRSSSAVMDDTLLAPLSIADFNSESNDSSDSSSGSDTSRDEEREDKKERGSTDLESKKRDDFHLLCYHVAAQKMLREYARWLEDGEQTRAAPHHADVARFIPEQGLEAAWRQELYRCWPPPYPDDSEFPLPSGPAPPLPHKPPLTPLKMAVDSIMRIKCRKRRSRKFAIKSQFADVNQKDARNLLNLVDKYMKEVEAFASDWSSELRRLSSLDGELWSLVSLLRQRRPLPPVTKQCATKCKPITFVIPHEESCISTGTEKGIIENRSKARTALRRLARPRPLAAKTMAALSIITRAVRSCETATRVADRAWRCAGAAAHCPPAAAALSALVEHLADKWLCEDGEVCAALVSQWAGRAGSDPQRALCGALVAPRRLPTARWLPLYSALLRTPLPSHTKFSYLSKFEINRWSENADSAQRRDMLEALITAAQKWGVSPEQEHQVLLELIGVHSGAVIGADELPVAITICARASVAATLPPPYWTHIIHAVSMHAHGLHFDQIGHLLRELGVIWWEARTMRNEKASAYYVAYAPHMATLLHVLLRSFVQAAVAQSYTPERVSWYVWCGAAEAWAAWAAPASAAPPLLPPTASLLSHFLDTLQQIMLDTSDIEPYFLRHIFEWTVQNSISVNNPSASQESRLQMSELLATLAMLPWKEYQWWTDKCIQPILQVCSNGNEEMKSWCSNTLRGITATTFLRGASDEQLAPLLATLLYLFTTLPLHHGTLEEATRLPWWRLPELALDEAMDRFFAQYYSPTHPYHELPQFRIILSASELSISGEDTARNSGRSKRARGIAQWVRASTQPALAAHAQAATRAMLATVQRIAPHIENSEDEIEELLSRAMIILCVEPAAAAALPVWQRWLSSARPRLVRASLSALAALTVFEYFAILADVALKTHLGHADGGGWEEVRTRWRSCPWRGAGALAARARLLAAYGAALAPLPSPPLPPAAAPAPADTRAALLALLATDLHFIENEVICGVWVCFACRVARLCGEGEGEGEGERGQGGERGERSDEGECAHAARALLARWGQEQRRSLLRVVTLQPATDVPTASLRLLCRLAECILSPSEVTARAYETCCSTVLGSSAGDALAWGRAPHPRRLPRLAMRLFPNSDAYFKVELDLAPEGV